MTLTFVTTNKGKAESLRERLPAWIELEVASINDLPEIQAESSTEVALEKAREAYRRLQKPLLIQDSSFHINARKGFPGVYVKYTMETINLEGMFKLMDEVKDRSCYFQDTVGYTENGTDIEIFTSQSRGTLALKIDPQINEKAWGDLWKVFIPDGFDKPIASLSDEERNRERALRNEYSPSCFAQLVEFIVSAKPQKP